MYGTLLLSKIRQAIFRRNPVRPFIPFHLYCDEFQEFQTSDFAKLLSMAGGLGLYLTLSHQYTSQLDTPILDSILGNVSTFCLFQLGPKDARVFQDQIPPIETELIWKRSPITGQMGWDARAAPFNRMHLTKLPQGKILYLAADGTAKIIPTIPPPDTIAYASSAEYIRNRTIREYSCSTQKECDSQGDAIDYDNIPPEKEIRKEAHSRQKARP